MAKAASVEDFLATLSHKRIDDVRSVRRIILSAHPAITERVKWNAPSFCWDDDDRVTMRLHPGDRLELILHRGAKPVDSANFAFEDPTDRVEWTARDRGIFRVGDPTADRQAIVALVEAWLAATASGEPSA